MAQQYRLLTIAIVFLFSFWSCEKKQKPADQKPSQPEKHQPVSGIYPYLTDADVESQSRKLFSEKFLSISQGKTFRQISDENFGRLEKDFENHRKNTRSLFLTTPTEELLAQISVRHETSFDSAEKILKQEMILSLDELVRRKVFSGSDKRRSQTIPEEEGKNGHQDLVYFAITPTTTKTSYGAVHLIFSQDLLEEGFFTPFSFRQIMSYEKPDTLDNDLTAANTRYRKWIFNGTEALRKTFELSLRQYFWEMEQNLPEELFKNYGLEMAALAKGGTYLPPVQPTEPILNLTGKFHQSLQKSLRLLPLQRYLTGELKRYFSRPLGPERLMGAYTFFPAADLDLPLINYPRMDSWELKIPQSATLEKLKALAVCEMVTEPIDSLFLEDLRKKTKSLEISLRNYVNHNRKIHLEVTSGICPKYRGRDRQIRELGAWKLANN